MLRVWWLSFLLQATVAFGSIIAKDDRAPIFDDGTIYDAIGKIVVLSSTGEPINDCTGTLIDDQHVLTAAHCFIDPITHEQMNPKEAQISFLPALKSFVGNFELLLSLNTEDIEEAFEILAFGKFLSIRIDQISLGTLDPFSVEKSHDWSVVKLHRKASKKMKRIPIAGADVKPYQTQYVTLVGFDRSYENGSIPLIHSQCRTQGFSNSSLIYHDCDTEYGASGAPLVYIDENSSMIVGIHVRGVEQADEGEAPSKDTQVNRAVSLPMFAKQIRKAL